MLDVQITGGGDWQVKNRDGESGGWAFEFRNDHFPDVDDTAFVLMALARVAYPDQQRMESALRRGLVLDAQHAESRRRIGAHSIAITISLF